MGRQRIVAVVAALLVAGFARVGTPGQAPHGGAGRSSRVGSHRGHGSRSSRGSVLRSSSPLVPTTPVVAPFPNVATLSGPLPNGLVPPLVPRARDLYRVRGPFNTQGSYYPAYLYGPYGDMSAPDETTAPAPSSEAPATGLLRLDVVPGSAQVFVDGYFAGTVDDAGRGLLLPEGPHRVELRAPGYAPTTFDVRITAQEAVTYRAGLEAATPARPVSAAARGPSTIYVIPGCYMGNVRPTPERVGPGCDVSRTRVVPSQGGAAAPR